jgi:thiamine biosynthesis lipoprotein
LRSTAYTALPALGWQGLITRRSFRAMNTDVLILAGGMPQPALLDGAERLFRSSEARFSRFLADSELCALNRGAGSDVPVSPEMLRILDRAAAMHRRTGGIFDPAILPGLEAAGYDRSFERVERDGPAGPQPPAHAGSFADLRIDHARGTVRAPLGLRIDLGGIGKGFTVDAAADLLRPGGNALVDAGGDIRAFGGGPDGDGWLIGVSDPLQPARLLDQVWLQDAALATSTTAARRWLRGGTLQHHIIDPRTGAPAESDAVSVTVLAASAVEAEVLAKAALVLGHGAGRALLEAQHAAGLFVLASRGVRTTAGWPGDTHHAEMEHQL